MPLCLNTALPPPQLESFSGADPARLEETIKRLSSASGDGAAAGSDSVVAGQFILNKHLNGSQLDCLNYSEDSEPKAAFEDNDKLLESDCDEQVRSGEREKGRRPCPSFLRCSSHVARRRRSLLPFSRAAAAALRRL